MTVNFVEVPPSGLILALQYYGSDEVAAMRLARLLADIEPRRRSDVTLAFCRREDMPVLSALGWETMLHCGYKFGVTQIQSSRPGEGHPDGCNNLAAGILDYFSRAWWSGNLRSSAVMLLEADAVPLRRDWLDIILREHATAIEFGKRVTGALTTKNHRHINGGLIIEASAWLDHPSLSRTPPQQAWDLFHAPTLLAEARPSSWMANLYGAHNWTPERLAALKSTTAILLNQKDESAISWAERELVAARPSKAA